MDNRISFAEYIKNEILDFNWEKSQLDILFYSFIRTNGIFKDGKFILGSSLKSQRNKISKLFEEFYNVRPKTVELETKINFVINDANFKNIFEEKWKDFKPKSESEHKAFVSGCFVGKGWISKPSSKYYHMEFRIGLREHSSMLTKSISKFDIESKTILKNEWFVIYIKKSTSISELLSFMEANQSRMYFEDERIQRNILASVVKMDSIEPYNQAKTKAISDVQIAAINKLKESPIWKTLDKKLIEIAELRLEFPWYSLSDLQITFEARKEIQVSKSTINNWLKQIVDLAE